MGNRLPPGMHIELEGYNPETAVIFFGPGQRSGVIKAVLDIDTNTVAPEAGSEGGTPVLSDHEEAGAEEVANINASLL